MNEPTADGKPIRLDAMLEVMKMVYGATGAKGNPFVVSIRFDDFGGIHWIPMERWRGAPTIKFAIISILLRFPPLRLEIMVRGF